MIIKKEDIPSFITEYYKTEFFSFILNITENEAENFLEGKFELNELQYKIINEIFDYCRKDRIQYIDCSSQFLSNAPHNLNYKLINKETHIYNYWRKQCGGTFDEIKEKDEILYILKTIGIEFFPTFYVKKSFYTMSTRNKLACGHKLASEFEKRVLNDSVLRKIFNEIGVDSAHTFYSFNNSLCRNGHKKRLREFSEILLENAFFYMCLNNEYSIKDYLKRIEETYNMIISLIKGEDIQIPYFICYSNFKFDVESKIKLINGEYLQYNKNLSVIHPFWDNPRKPTKDNYYGFIYKGYVNYKIDLTLNKYKDYCELDEINEIEKSDENICLSLSLSCKRDPHISYNKCWIVLYDPFDLEEKRYIDSSFYVPTLYYAGNETEKIDFEEWFSLLSKTNDEKIRLAKRKIISSASERLKPIDGFIDSIIAWENLFGDPNGELSFRITSAISKLLENDKSKRLSLQKELKEIYSVRSKVVHGSKELNDNEAIEKRDVSLKIGIGCLEKLYKDYPELINVENRAIRLLLEY